MKFMIKYLFNDYRRNIYKNVIKEVKEFIKNEIGKKRTVKIKIFGSFISQKEKPNDLDILVIIKNYTEDFSDVGELFLETLELKSGAQLTIVENNIYGKKVENDILKEGKNRYGKNYKLIDITNILVWYYDKVYKDYRTS